MIDPEHETLITLKQLCKAFPGREGKGVSLSCVWRWVLHGRQGHRLETLLVGGRRYTSKEAVRRFIAALNKPKQVDRARQPVGLTVNNKVVDAELDAEGF